MLCILTPQLYAGAHQGKGQAGWKEGADLLQEGSQEGHSRKEDHLQVEHHSLLQASGAVALLTLLMRRQYFCSMHVVCEQKDGVGMLRHSQGICQLKSQLADSKF